MMYDDDLCTGRTSGDLSVSAVRCMPTICLQMIQEGPLAISFKCWMIYSKTSAEGIVVICPKC